MSLGRAGSASRRGPCAVAIVAIAALAACPAEAAGDSLPRLKPAGRYLVDDSGAKATLKGCNLGNWLLIEPWMLGIGGSYRDQHSLTAKLESRFGSGRAARLIEAYRGNWITRRELDLVKSFGFNVVRLPFHYSLLEDDTQPLVLRKDAFAWLDRAVELAERAGMYTILDMHGVPGGQSVDAPTGRVDTNGLWGDPSNVKRTLWLWQRIAERYRDRASVVAYDLINEPWGDFRVDVRPRLLDLVGRLHDAIRTVDPDKLIFAPGSLRGITFYGNPREHGWKNIGFTEHFYPGLFGQGAPTLETHAQFIGLTVPARQRLIEQLDVPYLVGEFNVVFGRVARPELMRRYYDEFGARGWLTAMWSARLINPRGGVQADSWCLVTNAGRFAMPDLDKASYEEVEQAFGRLGTMELAVDQDLRAALTAIKPDSLLLADLADLRVAAAPGEAMPGWTGVDVSATPRGGLKTLPHGAVRLYGGGSDLWGNHDEFHFLHREAAGDFAVRNHLLAFAAPHPFSKAGWMLRGSLDPDAPHVLVHAFADGRVMMTWRAEGGGLTHERTLAISGLPVGLGLERKGRSVAVCYTDAEGGWQRQPIPAEVRLPDKSLLGLMVMSHEETVLASATFDGLADPQMSPDSEPASENLLQNASFEVVADGPDAADRARQWDRWGDWFNREQDWKPLRDGRCVLGYHHWQIESAENSGTYQDVTGLKPGERVTFSVYANRDEIAAGKHGPESVELRIESRYRDRLLTVASQTYPAGDIATGSRWSCLAVTGSIPTDHARVLIIANPSRETPRDAALKFDVASLRPRPASAAGATTLIQSQVRKGGEK